MFESKTWVLVVVGSYDFRTGMISWRINKNSLPFFLSSGNWRYYPNQGDVIYIQLLGHVVVDLLFENSP